jgi:hypothetical protein
MMIQIKISDAQRLWLETEVAAGRFPSLEAATQMALDNLLPGDLDDLEWARPYLDEARASPSEPLAAVRQKLAERMRRLGG